MFARIVIGEALLNIAGFIARTGRRVLGDPIVMLTRGVPEGSNILAVNKAIPSFTQGLKLEANGMLEIVKVRGVQGTTIAIDRPTVQAYPAGSILKVLV